jgi:predicted PurR-regulated permease PerM
MTEELESANSKLERSTAEDERIIWSSPLFWGLLFGAIVSFVAAIRRRLSISQQGTSPWLEEPEVYVPLPERPAPAIAKGNADSAPAEPSPGAMGPDPQTTAVSGPALDARRPSPPRPASTPAPSTLDGGLTKQGPLPSSQSRRWREPTKYVVGVGLFFALLFVLYISRSVIPIIVLGALLALVVHPVIGFLQRRIKLSKGLSIAITYLLIIALLVLIPLVVVPNVISAINDLINIDFQNLAQNIAQALQDQAARVAQIPVLNAVLAPFLDSLAAAFQGISSVERPEAVSYHLSMGGIIERLAQTLGTLATVLGPIVSAVISLVFMLLVSFHLSLSGNRILEGYPRLLPPAYAPEITALLERIGGVWTSFLRGQLALMVIVGVMVWLGNALLGNQAPLLLGIISGTLELIPNLGPALALIPGVGLALLFGSSHFALPPLTFALIVLAFYLLVQVTENQLIVPYVLGGALDVPPLVVILGVMVGGTVAGILGVLLATPIIATGREVFSYLYDKILEPPEVEEPPEERPSFLDSLRGRVRGLRLPFGLRAGQSRVPEEETE